MTRHITQHYLRSEYACIWLRNVHYYGVLYEFAVQHLCETFWNNYKAKNSSIKPFAILLEGHIFISFSNIFLEMKLDI